MLGAFLTAAYMTRCVYLTFFGDFRGHGEPHESPPAITVPLVVLAVLSVLAGWLYATVAHVEKFQQWFEPRVAFPAGVVHPPFEWSEGVLAVAAVAIGFAVAYLYYWRDAGPHGATARDAFARRAHTFLVEKLYLDDLYTGLVVGTIKGPVARATSWVDDHVIDGAVNAVAGGARAAARFTYEVLDQRVVDGTVNGLAEASDETGGLVRSVQSGRLQWYAAVLFLAVAILSLALVVFN